jgi:aryl carrier-like protein
MNNVYEARATHMRVRLEKLARNPHEGAWVRLEKLAVFLALRTYPIEGA